MADRLKVGWAIVHAATGKLVVLSGQMPLFWLRRVARDAANDHGFTTCGKDPDVLIRRVAVQTHN